jgi:pyruvate dehydrogenase E1 component alpha subunit
MNGTRDLALQRLRNMVTIRRFEEKCAELYSASKIRGFLHLYIGEEAVAVGAMEALRPQDAVLATYREHGHALIRGVPMPELMAEMYGKAQGSSHGRGGSMHIFNAARRFYGGSAIVAGGLPLAVGLALADKLQNRRQVSACFFGDGATAEGEFHECANLASLWKLPVLFLCENNQYAMGTALRRYQAQPDLSARGRSYGMPAEQVDGMDVEAVAEATARLAAGVREGSGPAFIEFITYRFRAHSMYDPDLYRDKAEIEKWKQRDPIPAFVARAVKDRRLTDADLAAIEKTVQAEVEAAVAFAEAGTWEPVEDLTKDVYTPGVPT